MRKKIPHSVTVLYMDIVKITPLFAGNPQEPHRGRMWVSGPYFKNSCNMGPLGKAENEKMTNSHQQ